MKLLVFADLHLDAPFAWAPVEVARRRRQALRDTLDAIVAVAAAEGVDALCCAGDLYEHDHVAPDTGEVVRAAFARLHPTPVLVAPGNHDWLGPASIYARTAWSPNVVVCSGDRLEPFVLADGFTIWGGAHRRPVGTGGFLDGFRVDRGGVNVGLFHGSFRAGLPFEAEGKQPHAPFDAEQIPAAGLDHTLVGHFHTPADGAWHTYPGNPEPLSFGELGERGAVVLELGDDGSVVRARHQVARTTLHDVLVDLTGCASRQELRERVGAAVTGLTGIVRATLTGEVEPSTDVELAGLARVAPHLDALVARLGQITVTYDLDGIAAQADTVRGRFVQDVRAAGLDPDLERRVLVAGLRALDGRRDLEVA